MARRKAWWIAGGVVGVVAVAAIAGPLVYAALEDDAAPAATVQAQPSDAALSTETDGTWNVGADSTAGYRVHEVLNGADVTVAGTTSEVAGSLTITDGSLTDGEIDVDVASIATDSDRRDAYFRDKAMNVSQYPTATFALDDPVELPELTGTPSTVTVDGELTLAGTTQEVTTDLAVVRTSTGVQLSGSVPVTFADYGISAPNLGFVSVDDDGSIEFFLNLAQ